MDFITVFGFGIIVGAFLNHLIMRQVIIRLERENDQYHQEYMVAKYGLKDSRLTGL